MKILSVRFQNLNSLKGEHFIPFNQPPLDEAGLFAITGPTGAGKTTLLDAVTIALYGCVHRHGRDADECMTRHTAESFSEVVFSVKGRSYKAKWSQRRARGKAEGKLQGVKMELIDAETNAILSGHSTSEARKLIEDTCGLDYNQFVRSVMLCQGDFTRFLKAGESERSELLEKITDTGIYSEISTFVFNKAKEEQGKLETLQQQMGNVTLMPAEQVAEAEAKLTSLGRQITELQKAQNQVGEQLDWLRKIAGLQQKKVGCAEKHQVAVASLQQHKSLFNQLWVHEKAQIHHATLAGWEVQENRKSELTTKLQQSVHHLKPLMQAADAAAAASKEKQIVCNGAEKTLTESATLLEEVIALDARIQTEARQVGTLKNNLAHESGDVEVKQLALEKARKELDDCHNQLQNLETWLAEHSTEACLEGELPLFFQQLSQIEERAKRLVSTEGELAGTYKQQQSIQADANLAQGRVAEAVRLQEQREDARQTLQTSWQKAAEGKTLEQWREEHAAWPVRINMLEIQQQRCRQYAGLVTEADTLQQKLQLAKSQCEEEGKELERLRSGLDSAQEKEQLLQKLHEQQLLIQKYEQDRLRLQPDEHCPLCGATEHPFAAHAPALKPGALDLWSQQKALVQQLGEQLAKKDKDLGVMQSQLREWAEQNARNGAAIQHLENGFNDTNRLLHITCSITDGDTVEALLGEAKVHNDAVIGKIKLLEKLDQDGRVAEREIQAAAAERIKASGDLELAQQHLQHLLNDQSRLQEEYQLLTQQQKDAVAEARAFTGAQGIPFEVADIAVVRTVLNKRAEEYKRYVQQQQQAQKQSAVLENKAVEEGVHLQEATDRCAEQQRIYTEAREKLDELNRQRQQMFGDKNPRQERTILEAKLSTARNDWEDAKSSEQGCRQRLEVCQSNISNWKKELNDLSQQQEVQLQQLLVQIKASGFDSLEALRLALLPDAEATRLQALRQQLEKEAHSASEQLQQTALELEQITQQQLTTDNESDLENKSREIAADINSLNQEIGAKKNELEQDRDLQRRFEAIKAQADLQRAEYLRWHNLNNLIGSSDGKKFRAFAQGLTLARLVELANRHLLRFSDRYSIVQAQESNLELQICDAYQAGAVRPVTTLSGGESFLVSLALALGLSDLASRKTRIESLFIDEGFGTLDADTLDVAITALENLQAGGKTIGIISHVEALKERIGVQVAVQKGNNGHSRIKLLQYGQEISLPKWEIVSA